MEEALPTTKKDFQALSIPRGYLGPALAHSRLLSLLAGFVKLAKHTCFSAGLMNSAGAVQHKRPRRESKSPETQSLQEKLDSKHSYSLKAKSASFQDTLARLLPTAELWRQ